MTPETFIPGYPAWIWRRSPMADGAWYDRFSDQAVDVDGDDLDPLLTRRVRHPPGSPSGWPNGTVRAPLARAAMYEQCIDVLSLRLNRGPQAT